MSQPLTHAVEATPNNQILALRVQVRQDVLASNPNIVPPEGTLYKDFEGRLFSKDWLAKFGNYRFIDTDNGRQQSQNPNAKVMGMAAPVEGINGGATLSLLFLPSLSASQRDTPFRTMTSMGNHRWPPILLELALLQERSIPQSNYFVRERYIPDVNEGTRFVQEEFFSDVPYIIPSYEVPIPSSVSYDVSGARGSFPECLHDDITIKGTQTYNLITFLTAGSAFGNLQGQFFPATNFIEWAPYVLSDDQNFQSGYYRKRITVWPPEMPEEITQFQR